ncbi:MAG: Crp/Fnr family transcriptional regulator, partial [Deltaproteobacteria bacterium]|nr:Crp/Fnr family transcriptional regulator [Deltaproteobacteria bacterium]
MSRPPFSVPQCTELDDSSKKLAYLVQINLFEELGMDDLKQIERAMPMLVCSPGKVLYRPNETGEVIFFLKEGRVHLYRMGSKERKILIAEVGPGAIFGEMALTGHGMYDTYAETIEESLICVMGRRDAGNFILSRPSVALRLLRVIFNRIRNMEDRLEQASFSTIDR